MGKFSLIVQAAVAAVIVSSLTGCSAPVDHKEVACESFGEMRQGWISPDSDYDVTRAQVASLSAVLSVWQTDKGEEDPLYWKFSSYTGAFLSMLLDTTPETARAYFDEEDANLKEIESECVLVSTYVPPLKISGGCWTDGNVSTELQVKSDGGWAVVNERDGLTKVDVCSDSQYPMGVEFTERRNASDQDFEEYRLVSTTSDGYVYTGCSKNAAKTEEALVLEVSDCK